MHAVRRVIVLAAALACVAVPAPAGAAASHRGPVVPPRSHQLSKLLGAAFVKLFSVPAPENPFTGGDPCLRLRPKLVVPALAPGGTATCEVRPGTRVLIIPPDVSCSDVEEAPFFGATPAERRRCAIAGLADVESVTATIDGTTVDLLPFFAVSADLPIDLPENNILTGVAQHANFTAAGWLALTHPFRRGEHTITVTTTGGEAAGTTTDIIDVTRHRR
jgi:hypothetical protein